MHSELVQKSQMARQYLTEFKDRLPFAIPEQFDPLGHVNHIEDLVALDELAWRHNIVVEVGAWAGLSTLSMIFAVERIYCIDPWTGNDGDRLGHLAKLTTPREAFQTFCRNMGDRLFHDVFPCVGHSATWAAIWPFKVDMVFIDGDHSKAAEDIRLWRPHVKDGGILAVHDYGVFPDVTEAVEAMMPGWKLAGRTIAWTKVENASASWPTNRLDYVRQEMSEKQAAHDAIRKARLEGSP